MATAPLGGTDREFVHEDRAVHRLFAVLLLAASRTAAHRKSDDETGSTYHGRSAASISTPIGLWFPHAYCRASSADRVGAWGFMGRTDTCVSEFARPAIPLGEGLHRVAVARKISVALKYDTDVDTITAH